MKQRVAKLKHRPHDDIHSERVSSKGFGLDKGKKVSEFFKFFGLVGIGIEKLLSCHNSHIYSFS